MSDAPEPYLSVVVTTRNDDHGGDPLQRFQAFLDSFAAQCERYRLDAEIVVVEWNPPADRPKLAAAMRWPRPNPFCTVRVIEVPNEVHRRLKGSQSLPLYQMIGKNVGIRRARGRFILCTNIDIIFSHELFAFIASRQLEPRRAYRAVRFDVAPGFPQDAGVDALLAYCRTHQIRGHFPNGSVPVEPDGTPALFDPDIAEEGAGIRFGRGWHMREGGGPTPAFRWIEDAAEIVFVEEAAAPRRLAIDLEPNRYDPSIPVKLAVTDGAGNLVARATLTEPATVEVMVPPGPAGRVIRLHAENAADLDAVQRPVFENRDRLRYVASLVRWSPPPGTGSAADETPGRSDEPTVELPVADFERAIDDVPVVEAREDGVRVVTLAPANAYALYYPLLRASRDGTFRIRLRYRIVEGEIILAPLSHDGLWWREHELTRGRDGAAAQIDLALALKAGEDVRLVVYNQHPLGDAASEVVVQALLVSDGLTLASPRGSGRTRGILGRAFRSAVPGSAQEAVKSGISRAMLPMVEWQLGDTLAEQVYNRLQEERRLAKEATLALVRANEELHARVQALEPLKDVAGLYAFLRSVHPDPVNANACGDFLLMAREHWFELRAYAEFEMYSMNIDGLFTYTAHYGGAPEQRLEPPLCIYHMEHAVGSGWTPEGEAALRQRMKAGGVDWLDWQTVSLWVSYMHWLRRPMIFNPDNWGYSDIDLPETAVSG